MAVCFASFSSMDTAYSLQIYEICGEKATFSFFLKKEEKTRAGKRGTGSAGKRMREEANGRGEKDRKSVPPETEKGNRSREEGREETGCRNGIPSMECRQHSRKKPPKTTGTPAVPITRTALRPVVLQPLFIFEIPDGQRRAEDHQADGKDIAQGMFQPFPSVSVQSSSGMNLKFMP